MTETSDKPQTPDLTQEIRQLRDEVRRLNDQNFFRRYGTFWRYSLASLFSGLMFGLGSALGASLLVSLVVYMLSSVNFIPVLGDWATQIIEYIQIPG